MSCFNCWGCGGIKDFLPPPPPQKKLFCINLPQIVPAFELSAQCPPSPQVGVAISWARGLSAPVGTRMGCSGTWVTSWGQSWSPRGVAGWRVGIDGLCGVKMVILWGLVGQLHGDRPVPQFPLQHLGVGNSCSRAGETGPVPVEPAPVHAAAPQPPIAFGYIKKKIKNLKNIYTAFCKDGEPSSCPWNDAGLGKTEVGKGLPWCLSEMV